MSSTINTFTREAQSRLSQLYDAGEARAIVQRLLMQTLRLSHTDLLLTDKGTAISVDDANRLDALLDSLAMGCPLQYVLGTADFYGLELRIAPGALIPRPETEELVALIADRHHVGSLRALLDVGTGSGCIPTALASIYRATAKISAIEISEEAAKTARANFDWARQAFRTDLSLIMDDLFVLEATSPSYPFDLIVSNPPYIHPDEAQDMSVHVLEHEPSLALFAPSERPTIYYEAIARLARKGWLAPAGHIYVELNPLYASDTLTEMVAILGDRVCSSELITDMSGKVRFAHIATHL